MNRKQLLKLRKRLVEQRKKLGDRINGLLAIEDRDLSPEEQGQIDEAAAQVDGLNARVEAIDASLAEADDEPEAEADDFAEAEEDADEPEAAPVGARSRAPPGEVVPGRGRSARLRGIAPGSGPAVHTADRRWSAIRALRLLVENRHFDGIEGEVHQELARHRGTPPQGILLPLGNEPEFRTHLFGRGERRDLTTSTGTGAVFTAAELPLIELLRAKMVLRELGATFLTGLVGKVAIPRQNAASTAYWVAEGVPVTASNPTVDNVPLADKTLGALVNISRKFLYQSSVDAETWVRGDIAQVLALELDRAGINGSGSGAVPLGIAQNTAIQTISSNAGLPIGTNGGTVSFAKVVAMESLVAANNADMGSLKYLTTPGLRGALKTTVKASGQPVYLYEDGEINGYPAIASAQVPSNLTKGTSSGICHALIFGNWRDLVVGQWGGIDTVVNPFTNQASGAVSISMMMEADIAVRHNESFAVILDATVA